METKTTFPEKVHFSNRWCLSVEFDLWFTNKNHDRVLP